MFAFLVYVVVTFLQQPPLFFTLFNIAIAICGMAVLFGIYLAIILLQFSDWLNRRYRTWVKALDLPYIFFGVLSLISIIDASPLVPEPTADLKVWSILFVTIAIAVRMAKAIIEVFFEPWTR